LSNLAAFIHYSATFAVAFFLSLYLQYIKKLSPQSAGAILVFQPVVMAVCSPFAGRLSDRIEPRIVASMGMALTAVGLFLLAFLQGNTGLEFVIADLILLGLGFALFSSPNTNAVMSSVEKRFYGVASGTLGTMRLTGQMLSMGIAMLIFAVHIGPTQITLEYFPVLLKSTRSAFILFGILCSGGVLASLARGRVHLEH
jgi:MFS family permease